MVASLGVEQRPIIQPYAQGSFARRGYSGQSAQAVWLQSGIRNDEVAEELARAGIKVVQDRCLMIEHRRAKH